MRVAAQGAAVRSNFKTSEDPMSVRTWSTFHSPYNEAEVRRVVPLSGGVYCLCVKYQSGGWKSFYVGKAESLESRLLAHLDSKEPNACIRDNVKYQCGFCWIEITTEEERSGAEKYLYDTLRPECNQNDPGGTPLRIPLPPIP